MMRRSFWLLLALLAGPAAAQPAALAQAIAAGQAGERFDGYMAAAATASPEVRRQVSAVNIRRRNLYVDLSVRRNVSVQLVGTAAACQLLGELKVGQAYVLEDNVWRRRLPGQPAPIPDYCR
jgi:uncharacterized protein YdbL (DUF1318 family)